MLGISPFEGDTFAGKIYEELRDSSEVMDKNADYSTGS
jgi:hypothetical protein